MALRDEIARILAEGHARSHADVLKGANRVPESEGRPSAVLIAITDRPRPGLILTQRSQHLRNHPGQVALPGGRIDQEDADVIAAALREAEEEIGLSRRLVDVIGTTDPFYTPSGFAITPVVGIIPADVDFVAEPDEVDAIFEVPLDYALDPAHRRPGFLVHEGVRRDFFEIDWEDRRIWGVTAAMLINLSFRLDPVALRALITQDERE